MVMASSMCGEAEIEGRVITDLDEAGIHFNATERREREKAKNEDTEADWMVVIDMGDCGMSKRLECCCTHCSLAA